MWEADCTVETIKISRKSLFKTWNRLEVKTSLMQVSQTTMGKLFLWKLLAKTTWRSWTCCRFWTWLTEPCWVLVVWQNQPVSSDIQPWLFSRENRRTKKQKTMISFVDRVYWKMNRRRSLIQEVKGTTRSSTQGVSSPVTSRRSSINIMKSGQFLHSQVLMYDKVMWPKRWSTKRRSDRQLRQTVGPSPDGGSASASLSGSEITSWFLRQMVCLPEGSGVFVGEARGPGLFQDWPASGWSPCSEHSTSLKSWRGKQRSDRTHEATVQVVLINTGVSGGAPRSVPSYWDG